MKSGYQLLGVCLVAFGATGLHTSSTAAEGPVVAQDLVNVRASTSIAAALWTRRLDSYTLQIVFPSSDQGCGAPRAPATAGTAQQTQSVPQGTEIDRSVYFIGNTIANLRGLDPCFGARTLTLVDGRRSVPGISPPDSSPKVEPVALQKPVVAPPLSVPGIQVWLLRADGTQISPVAMAMETSHAYGCRINCPVSGKQYRFSLLEGAQAAAVAISVDDVYYIEKLKPLEPTSATQ
jgi:hypothetical protein